jgi:hypothetical protein
MWRKALAFGLGSAGGASKLSLSRTANPTEAKTGQALVTLTHQLL